jgi:hypothetical protein
MTPPAPARTAPLLLGALWAITLACSEREPPKVEATKAERTPPPAPVVRDAGAADRLSMVERVNRLMAKRREEAKLAAQLAAEEKARVLEFDRTKLAKHAALFAFIEKARKQLDDAADKAKGDAKGAERIEKLAASMRKGIEAQGKVLHSIDPKGGNSNITTDHDVMLNTLATDYPVALVRALSGDAKALQEVRAEMDQRQKKVASYLAELKAAKH